MTSHPLPTRVAVLAAAFALLSAALLPAGTAAAGYRQPPEPIPSLLEASPRLPRALPDPTGRTVLLAERPARPSLLEGGGPLRRVTVPRPDTHRGPIRPPAHSGFVLKDVGGAGERRVVHPEGLGLGPPMWSPNGRRIAFPARGREGLGLWVAEAARPVARRIAGPGLQDAFGRPCRWMPDARHLLCRRRPGAHEPASIADALLGPIALGPDRPAPFPSARSSGLRRAGLSGHPLASRLALVDAATGRERPVGPARLLESAVPSPNGAYLLVSRIAEPRSLLVEGAPARTTEVWDATGRSLRRLAAGSGAGEAPAARGFRWAAGEPATLVWPERLAGGSPARDRLVRLEAPFEGAPSEILRLRRHFAGIAFVPDAGSALVREYDPGSRRRRTWVVGTGPGGAGEARLLWERSVDDAYADPGRPLRVAGPSARRVVASHEGAIFLAGRGAGSEGARPFLDRLDLETLERERLWQSPESRHERVTGAVAPGSGAFLLRFESPSRPPNLAVLRLRGAEGGPSLRELTALDAPASPLRAIRRRTLRYRRADGVPLAGTLYVPAERKEGERLPLVVWIYPRKHASAETTGQAPAPSRRYLEVEGVSPLPLATQGFAVLAAAMPVVGAPEEANDRFAGQIVENARAAVEAAVASGVVDGERVAVAGHSYGAFAAVSLLARTELFRAGVAMSGAYNRTLTPFGFQSERRTLWEAPETYLEMSPLLRAPRIRAPLLLVHGERDEHAGTPPEQSVLLYRAIRENGGTARLVLLPREGHVYRSREATLHVYAELVAWLERYLKDAPQPRDDEPLRRAGSAEGDGRSG